MGSSRRLFQIFTCQAVALFLTFFYFTAPASASPVITPNSEAIGREKKASQPFLTFEARRSEPSSAVIRHKDDSLSMSSWAHYIRKVFVQLYPHYNTRASKRGTLPSQCTINSEQHRTNELYELVQLDVSQEVVPPSSPAENISFIVINQAQANAYALPADYEVGQPARIMISLGLLELISNESALAFVLAHEMGHLKFDHFSPHVPALFLSPETQSRIALVHREWEHVADRYALVQLVEAGYDPAEGVSLMERLERLSADHRTEERALFHHHPAIEDRLTAMRSHLGLLTQAHASTSPDLTTFASASSGAVN